MNVLLLKPLWVWMGAVHLDIILNYWIYSFLYLRDCVLSPVHMLSQPYLRHQKLNKWNVRALINTLSKETMELDICTLQINVNIWDRSLKNICQGRYRYRLLGSIKTSPACSSMKSARSWRCPGVSGTNTSGTEICSSISQHNATTVSFNTSDSSTTCFLKFALIQLPSQSLSLSKGNNSCQSQV